MKMWNLLLKLFWCVLAGAFAVGSIWLLKTLIVHGSPDFFCAGLVGGAIWMYVMGKAWQLFKWTCEDVEEAAKAWSETEPDQG